MRTKPGQTMVTRTPSSQASAASDSKNPWRACLAAEQDERSGVPSLPTRLETTTVRPEPAAIIDGSYRTRRR